MGLKKLLIVAIIFAALVALYVWDQGRIQKESAVKEEQSRLVAAAKGDITGISIQRQDGKVELVKDAGTWKLTQPVTARAGEAAVENIINQLDQARRQEPFEVSKVKLAEYGLANPTVKVEVKAASQNDAGQVEFGSETPDGQQVYGRAAGTGPVFTVPAAVLAQLNTPVRDLRDKRLLPAEMSSATAFEIIDDGRKIAASKQNGQWSLTAPEKLKGDDMQIRQFLGDIGGAEIKDFIDTRTLNLASMGLNPPKWRGLFTINDGTTTHTYELTVGDANTSPSTGVYAKAGTDTYVMLAAPELARKIHASVNALRDKALFSLKSADVGSLLLTVRGVPLALERDSSGLWKLRDDPDTPVDQAKVSQTVNMLTELQATRFYKPGETPAIDLMGLSRPTLLARIASRDHKTTETLETGAQAKEGGEFVWARLVNTDQIVGIDWTKPGSFFLTRDDVIERNLFSFGEEAAKTIRLGEEGKTTMTLTRQPGGAWSAFTAATGSKTVNIDGVRVTAVLNAMLGLRWERRLDPRVEGDRVLIKTQRLDRPPRYIEVLDAQGKRLASLAQGSDTEKLSYIKTDSHCFTIDRARMQNFAEALNRLSSSFKGK
ncbi:DUF4340 domain-containing protein [bacterium]|nr:DUF4340 domain-containing protein [bacterium]